MTVIETASVSNAVTPLTLTLFGPIHALVKGKPLPHLRSRKALWLLALLTLRHDRPVEREWLAGTLWPDADQDQAYANLRVVLSELRKALGSQGERLRSPDRRTISLELGGAEVDVISFDAAVKSHDLPTLAKAVSLYRGPLLEGCAEEWAPQERRTREENCLRTLQTLAGSALKEGDHATAAEYFRRAVALDPWRDACRRGLMEALARGGDSNAALQVYREFTALLRTDPKASPDEETSALYARLRKEARSRTAAPVTDAGDGADVKEGTAPVISGYLPHPLTQLIGREDERLEVAAKLRRSRLVTLTGPGGIGKTRLAGEVATEVASDFTDGVCLVALEALSEGKQIVQQIASALGVREVSGKSLLENVTDHLRPKRQLLVLDNCEHLRAACAEFAEHLLHECARVRVLATSREALGITGETLWPVPSLAVPDPAHLPAGRATLLRVLMGYESVQLFVERAQAAQKSFALTAENAEAVAQVCARLEGMPLAIELAAARVNVLTISQIASRLEDHLGFLSGGSRAGPSRQQTLRATLDWSYSLLNSKERVLLQRLSVFAGGWTLDAAEAVCAGDGIETGQVLDVIASLVEKSLIVFEVHESEGRYRFLETVRQYAAELLKASGKADAVMSQHQTYYLTFAVEAEPHLKGSQQTAWLRRMDLEHANMLAALECVGADVGCEEKGLLLASALCSFWDKRGHYSEGRYFLAHALELARELDDMPIQVSLLSGAGRLAQRQSDYPAAQMLYQESLNLCRENGDKAGVAKLLGNLGVTYASLGDPVQARTLYEESLSLHQELGDQENIAQVLGNLGNLSLSEGDPILALSLYEQSLHLHRQLGDNSKILWMLRCLVNVVSALGDTLRARDLAEECLSLAREEGERRAIVESLISLGSVCLSQEDLTAAQSSWEESLRLAKALNDPWNIAWSLLCLGLVAIARNDANSALSLCGQGLNLFREIGNRRGEAWALFYLGEVTRTQGDYDIAQTWYKESITILQVTGDQGGLWRCINGLAEAMLGLGETQRSTILWGVAEVLCERVGEPRSSKGQAEYVMSVTRARAELGEDAYVAAWEIGRAMPLEQAVAYALED